MKIQIVVTLFITGFFSEISAAKATSRVAPKKIFHQIKALPKQLSAKINQKLQPKLQAARRKYEFYKPESCIMNPESLRLLAFGTAATASAIGISTLAIKNAYKKSESSSKQPEPFKLPDEITETVNQMIVLTSQLESLNRFLPNFWITLNQINSLYAKLKIQYKDYLSKNFTLVTKDNYPELFQAIQAIKKASHIPEDADIPFYVDTNNMDSDADGRYYGLANAITINAKSLHNLPWVIHTITHELAHYKQNHQYSDIFRVTDWNKQGPQLEESADAAGAGLFDCPDCLHDVQLSKALGIDENGYFNQEAFIPYIQRAQQEGQLCKAHEDDAQLHWYQSKPTHSLIDYLPQALAHFEPKLVIPSLR